MSLPMSAIRLKVRPVYHRLEGLLRAHVLFCMPARPSSAGPRQGGQKTHSGRGVLSSKPWCSMGKFRAGGNVFVGRYITF